MTFTVATVPSTENDASRRVADAIVPTESMSCSTLARSAAAVR